MAKVNLFELEPEGIVRSLKGQRILIYGSNSVGKTKTLSKMADGKVLLIAAESGDNGVSCAKVKVHKWTEFVDLVNQLTSEKPSKTNSAKKEWEVLQEKYEVIGLDTADALIELSEAQTCTELGVRDLSENEDTTKNGWAIYRKNFKKQIEKLCSYGYCVVEIAHEEIVLKDANGVTVSKRPKNDDSIVDFVQPKGTENKKSANRYLRDNADFCMYIKSNGVDENGKVIPSSAICVQTKNVFARSRYDIVSTIPVFSAANLTKAILDAIEKTAKEEDAQIVEWEHKSEAYSAKELIEMIEPYYKAIYEKNPDKVIAIVEEELGEGVKVSKATDDNLAELENIYNKLVSFADDQQIKI